MTDDVVAELDDWLMREATTPKHYPADDVDTGLLQRARDEIVALRTARNECERQFQEQVAKVSRLLCQLEAVKGIAGNERRLSEAIAQQAHAEALEKAARLAQDGCLVPPDGGSPTEEEREMCERIAAAILALKAEH